MIKKVTICWIKRQKDQLRRRKNASEGKNVRATVGKGAVRNVASRKRATKKGNTDPRSGTVIYLDKQVALVDRERRKSERKRKVAMCD